MKEKLIELLEEVFERGRKKIQSRCGSEYLYDDFDDIINSDSDIQEMINKILT